MRPLTNRERALALAGLTFAGLALRLVGLGSRSLSGDEEASVIESQGISMTQGVPEGIVLASDLRTNDSFLILTRAAEFDLPAYVWVLRSWTRLAGTSEFAVRFPSAVLGAVAIPLIFLVGVRTVGPQAGLIAAALLAVAPGHVQMCQQARVYSAGVVLCLVSLVLLLFASSSRRLGIWLAYGFSVALVPLAHFMATPTLVAQAVWLRVARAPVRRVLQAALVAVATFSLSLSLGVGLSIFATHISAGLAYRHPPPRLLDWARPASLPNLLGSVGYAETILFGVDTEPLGFRARSGLVLTLVMLGLMARGAARAAGPLRALLVCGLFASPAAALAVSIAYGHVVAMQWKYGLWSLVYVALLVGKGLEALPWRRLWATIVFATWGVSAAATLVRSTPHTALRSRDARRVERSVRPGDVLAFGDLRTLLLYAAFTEGADRLFLGPAARVPPEIARVMVVGPDSVCYERTPSPAREIFAPCAHGQAATEASIASDPALRSRPTADQGRDRR